MTNPRLLAALQKIVNAQKAGDARVLQGQMQRQEATVMQSLVGALEKMGNVSSITGPKGDKGDRGLAGYSPIKGRDYFDGQDGKEGKEGESVRGEKGDKGNKGDRGDPGDPATVDVLEMFDIASQEVQGHEKKHDHSLIHDSKTLGPLELDVDSIVDGKFFTVKDGKIVCVDLPQPIQQALPYYARGGGSDLRSFPVRVNTEVDARGIYIVDATNGNITITLPSASGRENHWYEIIRIDSTANTVTIVPTGSETMSGMTDYLMQQWSDVKLFAYQGSYLIRQAS